jgi:hypothetical protein
MTIKDAIMQKLDAQARRKNWTKRELQEYVRQLDRCLVRAIEGLDIRAAHIDRIDKNKCLRVPERDIAEILDVLGKPPKEPKRDLKELICKTDIGVRIGRDPEAQWRN